MVAKFYSKIYGKGLTKIYSMIYFVFLEEIYMNIKEMAEKIIRDTQKPLSPVEIWEIAEPQGYREKLKLTGRTMPIVV